MAANLAQSQSTTEESGEKTSSRRLAGKVAVVTGGSSGIGFAIAQALASEGCAVFITGRDQAKLDATAEKLGSAPAGTGAQVHAQVCDVRDPASVEALFEVVRRRFGTLDILINNAGITQPVVSVEQTSVELWQDVIATNLTGVFLCTRAALPLMKAGATIVNNLSAAAKQVFPNYASYSAAKRGALGFSLSLREELIPRGIRVMALMPGATYTPMWEQIMPNAPRERMMDVTTIAQAVLFAVLLPSQANLTELLMDPTGGAL